MVFSANLFVWFLGDDVLLSYVVVALAIAGWHLWIIRKREREPCFRAFLGNHWLFQLDTPLGPVQATQVNAGLPSVAEGDSVGLTWATEHARVVPRSH